MRVGPVTLALAVLACACELLSTTAFDDEGRPDASAFDAAPSDAGAGDDRVVADTGPAPPVRPCSTRVFGTPRLVAELSAPGAISKNAKLTSDARTVVFTTNRAGGDDLWSATRASATGTFGAPQEIGGVDTLAQETQPWLSDDGLLLVFTRFGGVTYDLYASTRSSPAVAFDLGTVIAGLDAPNANEQSAAPANGAVYFVSDRGGTGYDIWRAPYAGSVTSAAAPALVNVSTITDNETHVAVTRDELVLYFASARDGGAGGEDIYRAERARPTDDFSAAVRVVELATPSDDWPAWVSEDDCTLWITAYPGDGGPQALYTASR